MPVYELPVTVVVTDEVTAVELGSVNTPYTYYDKFTKTGWAKKHPKDTPNASLSLNLALARALANLSDEYARRAAEETDGPVKVGDALFSHDVTHDYGEFDALLAKVVGADYSLVTSDHFKE